MNVRVVVATRLFPPEVGAAAFRLRALAHGLAAAGAEVQVLTTRPPRPRTGPGNIARYTGADIDISAGARGGHGGGRRRAGIRLSRWPVLRDAGGNVRGYLQYLSFDIPLFFRLLASRADIVVAEPPPTTGVAVALSCRLRRRPFVYYAADVWTEALAAIAAPAPVVALMRAVEGAVLRSAATVIAVSEPVAEQLEQFGVRPERVVVVGNGVDTDVFRPDATEPAPGAPDGDGPDGDGRDGDGPCFVYTGTMSEWQGAEVFIEALPRVLTRYPGARIYFFGQGAAEPALKELAARTAPDRVHFGGVIPPEQAASRLRRATAALVSIKPGLGYDFAKPTKVYAAAGCGTPVIYAGSGAGAEIVAQNGLGRAVRYDAGVVAEAMLAEAMPGKGMPGVVPGEVPAGPAAERDRAAAAAARVHWVRHNASLARTGALAAAQVLSAADPRRKPAP